MDKIKINLVVMGPVDSGKSTTTGHLTMKKFKKDSAEVGF